MKSVSILVIACVLSAATAANQNIFSNGMNALGGTITGAVQGVKAPITGVAEGVKSPITEVVQGVKAPIAEVVQGVKAPIDETIVTIASSQCSNVKKLVGVAYDEIEGEKEPDLNQLTLNFQSSAVKVSYNINTAARQIIESNGFDPHQKLYIFIHGFIDDPNLVSFSVVNNALFSQGKFNVLALDASSLIRWLYLRSTTYVRFIGEKLGEVLAAMVRGGANPSEIQLIGHSLGAHISSFAGKTFTNLTGLKLGRISGLDPAGPCFTTVDGDLRLKATDADFVDVMHTDGGVFGLTDAVGHVDFFPNGGKQQPNCLTQTCSHNRAWVYYAESVVNPKAFPAVRCANYEAFKKGNCEDVVSYMGFPYNDGTRGLFFLQTGGDSPYGHGEDGTKYKTDSFIKKLF